MIMNSVEQTKLKSPAKSRIFNRELRQVTKLSDLHVALLGNYRDIAQVPFMKNTYSVFQPELLQHILLTNAANYNKAEFTYDIVRALLGDTLLTTSDKTLWLSLRRHLQPVFQPSNITKQHDIVIKKTAALIQRWKNYATHAKTVNLKRELKLFIIDLAQALLLNDDFSNATTTVYHFNQAADNHTSTERRATPWLPLTRVIRYHHSRHRYINALTQLIKSRQQQDAPPLDYLTLLLSATDPYTQQSFSLKMIIDSVMTFLTVGIESMANVLIWTWYRLAYKAEAESRLHEEVDAIFQKKSASEITVDDIPYCSYITKEILRLYPPVWLIGRSNYEDDILGEYLIKKNASLLICPYAIHRNPDYFPHPEKFDPNRFTPEASKLRPKFAYIPFGAGPRACIGISMASTFLPIIIAEIARNFSIRFQNHEFAEENFNMFLGIKKCGKAILTSRLETASLSG